ncbi:MAG: hypothetical protein HYU41_10970 [Candidatus Rokubacteria bacterium]|nr:hypothetical protein [Candidatus Rokubacteria bacterium]
MRVARLVILAIPASIAAYAAIALAHGWWLSGAAAPFVAWLLWRRHPRARFSAYVLLSVVVLRALVGGPWWVVLYAIAVIAGLQTPPATARWPRIRGDRMSRP